MKTRWDQQGVSKATKRTKRSVYDEDTFRHFLTLDKNRTKRSGRPFLILLVDVGKLSGSRDAFEDLFEALRSSLRETDYVGWYQASQVAGAVLALSGDHDCVTVCATVRKRAADALEALFPGTGKSLSFQVLQLVPDQQIGATLWP